MAPATIPGMTSGPGKRANRKSEMLLHIDDYPTYQELQPFRARFKEVKRLSGAMRKTATLRSSILVDFLQS